MDSLYFDPGSLVPIMIFAIPIVAIVGGISAAIVRTIGQQRLIELAQRERIAAIERGVDPAKLPPVPAMVDEEVHAYTTPYERARRLSQGLMIGGLVTLATGIGLGIFLGLVADEEHVWAVGLIPALVGVALLISARIVRPESSGAMPPRV